MTDDKAVLSGSAPFPLDEAAHEPAIRLGSKGIGSDRLRGCSRQHAVDPESLCIEPTIFVEQCKGDRKSTRLNSSHSQISYAVFCLKKKKKNKEHNQKSNLEV